MAIHEVLTLEFFIASLALTVRIAPTILIASMGELITEKSGVLNLGVEGIMLLGAFTAFLVSFITGNPWMGALSAMLVGILIGLVFGVLTVYGGVNQVVVGLGIWLAGFGLSDVLYRIFFRDVASPTVNTIGVTPIPVLSDIPIIGPILFNHNPLVYFSLLLVPAVALFLKKTNLGMRIRAVGENPKAADSMGINVYRTRMVAVLIGSMLAGLGGAYFTTAFLSSYVLNITFGRGFIALAMIYFGNWNPYRALIPILIFNYVDSLQLGLQSVGVGIKYYFLNMLPWITVIALIPIFGRKAQAPAALLQPYRRAG